MNIVQGALIRHTPSGSNGKKLRIRYGTQAHASSPTFVFFVNDESLVQNNFERFLESAIREQYPFTGTPLRFIFRKNVGNRKDFTKRKDNKSKSKFARSASRFRPAKTSQKNSAEPDTEFPKKSSLRPRSEYIKSQSKTSGKSRKPIRKSKKQSR
jgi:hypothetical protein